MSRDQSQDILKNSPGTVEEIDCIQEEILDGDQEPTQDFRASVTADPTASATQGG